jgi:hypothetical protein
MTVNGPTRYLDISFTSESDLTFKETREEPEIPSLLLQIWIRNPFLAPANMDDKNKLRKMTIP